MKTVITSSEINSNLLYIYLHNYVQDRIKVEENNYSFTSSRDCFDKQIYDLMKNLGLNNFNYDKFNISDDKDIVITQEQFCILLEKFTLYLKSFVLLKLRDESMKVDDFSKIYMAGHIFQYYNEQLYVWQHIKFNVVFLPDFSLSIGAFCYRYLIPKNEIEIIFKPPIKLKELLSCKYEINQKLYESIREYDEIKFNSKKTTKFRKKINKIE